VARGWRADPASVRVIIGFSLPTREAVESVTGADVRRLRGAAAPADAFWGARLTIVADPDCNDIGLISPRHETRRTWPPEESRAP
jgi:hypothetical protein